MNSSGNYLWEVPLKIRKLKLKSNNRLSGEQGSDIGHQYLHDSEVVELEEFQYHSTEHSVDEFRESEVDYDESNYNGSEYSGDEYSGDEYSLDYEDNGFLQGIPVDDSPYPEVRASVPNTDDFNMPHNTIRMWAIGLFMTTLGSGLNMLFSLHSPIFVISTFLSSIVAWPLGRFWDAYMPDVKVMGLSLNPSPFNIKEHALIIIMSNVSFGEGAAYMADVILSLEQFYNIDFGWKFRFISTITTQVLGFSMAGIMRRVLVYPGAIIWPSNLVSTTFLTNIHMNTNHMADGWKISRLRFFLIVATISFLWYFIPGFLWQSLSYFSWTTWFAPNNVIVNQVFGVVTGLGVIPITFDWNQVAGYLGSPLIPPFFAIANIMLSIVVMFWVVVPFLHYSNVSYNKYLPMSDSNSYDRFQNNYQVGNILTNNQFDLKKYQEYSPLFLSTTFIVSYGISFAAVTSTIVHTILFHGKDIYHFWNYSREEPDDIHMRLMKRYREVPDYWFLICFFVWDTGLPIWALLIGLIFALVMIIPIGLIYALTNIPIGLNVITEFMIGYMVPGKPAAMMLYKTFSYISNNQALTFLQDLKLGHYMKIDPGTLFFTQLIATIWGAIVQILVLQWSKGNIKDLCKPFQESHFTCPQARVFFNASIIWGVIGPQRLFKDSGPYFYTKWFFLLGALLPIINWLVLRKKPKSFLRYFHWPIFFNGPGTIPPATPFNLASYCCVGYIFGYWLKRKWFSWWAKYNYSLSAGLDLGLAIGSLAVFLFFSMTGVIAPRWWGNTVHQNTLDYQGLSFQVLLKKGDSFGPSKW
ncbi:small oligopeptide transporter [Nadsonia fulvescens var. elongata DSM 6958]|uniref:Small oligopeptide transporter n=1 Tax=Nadsonia fulvescens var. elongata DSM 6958 TaxID=857566 RepID=A0A1E3PR29_9ASCO|nr:small oligopeptide transporter [Nadsonia fulvescens var. elongata DSM 6958]